MRMFMRNLALLTLALAALAGCNKVAVLEGELQIGPKPSDVDELYVNVQAMRSDGVGFGTEWDGGSLSPMALGVAPETYRFSLTTKQPDTDLHLRVRFCLDPDCISLPVGEGGRADPQSEIQFDLGNPFYVTEEGATRWGSEVPLSIPACVTCPEGTECGAGATCSPLGVCETSPGVCEVTAPPGGCEIVPAARPTWRCTVDKCDIQGCVEGTIAAGYCSGGRHFCE